MRIALGIEYDGGAYSGWQRQKHGSGVQESLELALSKVADEAIDVTCAGRTDAGVHASGQVVHFDTQAARSMRGWLLGANSNLPPDINATFACEVDDSFHARFSAIDRTYHYRILNRLYRSALQRNRSWWVHRPLDHSAMSEASRCLLGEHDFSAFRASGCQASTAVRNVFSVDVVRQGDWVDIHICANAFLQHMVRNITGTLVAVGCGDRQPGWMDTVLKSGDRTQAGIAAPPQGLTLIAVTYPDKYQFRL